jgi:hypothetical protein
MPAAPGLARRRAVRMPCSSGFQSPPPSRSPAEVGAFVTLSDRNRIGPCLEVRKLRRPGGSRALLISPTRGNRRPRPWSPARTRPPRRRRRPLPPDRIGRRVVGHAPPAAWLVPLGPQREPWQARHRAPGRRRCRACIAGIRAREGGRSLIGSRLEARRLFAIGPCSAAGPVTGR